MKLTVEMNGKSVVLENCSGEESSNEIKAMFYASLGVDEPKQELKTYVNGTPAPDDYTPMEGDVVTYVKGKNTNN